MAPGPGGTIVPNAGPLGVSDISQMETVGMNPQGRPVPGYQVSFRSSRGVLGSVFVPKDRYSVLNVRAAIADHARELDQVQALAG